jgi:FixJ family two-component response regulator
VILTAHGSIDLAVRAIKEGADQFVTKPIELPALLVMLQRVLEEQPGRQRRLARKSRHALESVDLFLVQARLSVAWLRKAKRCSLLTVPF